jgi:exopolysaccharide biosynthesis polyprenyl glycosylphosphotransferase
MIFRFNRFFFIISNYLTSILCFIVIFNLRYSWLDFNGVEKRILNFYTIILFAVYSLALLILNISFKIYEINKISRFTESIFVTFFISIISMGVFGIFFYFTKTDFARFVFFTVFLIIPFINSMFNKIFFIFFSKKRLPVKIYYFGSEINSRIFDELIKKYQRWFYMSLHKIIMNAKPDILKKELKKCKLLVVDTDQKYKDQIIKILNDYEIEDGKIYSLIDMFAYFDQSLPSEIISNRHFELFTSFKLDSIYNKYIKRVCDILISLILIILLFPAGLLTAILVKLSSKGKVFFIQKRLTLHGREFSMYKFRSMKISRNHKEEQFTAQNDERLTVIGKIIRPLRLDEIPQLLNVLKGDMSLIGPRPERPELIEEILKKYPLFKKRLLIKPGLTGWAQVKYDYVNDIKKMNVKLSYDLYYINNLSFVFDLKIMLYTFETVFFRRGAI